MLVLALTVLCWVPALVGLGALLPYRGDPALRRIVSGVQGIALLAVLGMVVHLLVAIGPAITSVFWSTGTGLFFMRRRWLREGLSATELAGLLCGLALMALLYQEPRVHYDAGLYYLQATAWITDHALRLGLANLHGRLAFNSSWFIVTAALELPLLQGKGAFFACALPIALASAAVGVGLRRVVAGRPSFGDATLAALLPLVAHATGGLGGAAPDQVAALLVFLALALWIRALESDPATFQAEALPALLLTALAVTVKLSAAPVLLCPAFALPLRRAVVTRRWLAGAAALMVAVFVPWLVRSILLSGCLVYPVAWSCLPGIPWAAPRASVQLESDWVRSWARTPEASPDLVLGNWRWLSDWARRMAGQDEIALFGVAMAMGLLTWLVARRVTIAVAIPVLTALAGLLYVFVSAPDPRFALGFLHALAFVPFAFAMSRMPPRSGARRSLALLTLAAFAAAFGRAAHFPTGWRLDLVTLPNAAVAATVERVSVHGVRVRVPVTGDQCWAAPEPCAPKIRPELEEKGRAYLVAGPR